MNILGKVCSAFTLHCLLWSALLCWARGCDGTLGYSQECRGACALRICAWEGRGVSRLRPYSAWISLKEGTKHCGSTSGRGRGGLLEERSSHSDPKDRKGAAIPKETLREGRAATTQVDHEDIMFRKISQL